MVNIRNQKCLFFAVLLMSPALIFSSEKKEFNLTEIIHIGLKNNPSITAKLKEVNARNAAYQAAKSLINPELELHKGTAKSYDSAIKRNTGGFSISQYLENPFKRHYRVQLYEKDWQASEYQYDYSKLEVIFLIKSSYYKILLLKLEEELAQKILDSIEETHHLIKKRAELGEVKELEAIKLYVEALRARNELSKIQTELKLAREILNKFLGQSLPPDYSLAGKLEYIPVTVDEESLLEKTLRSYPLIMQKEKEVELAKNNLNYVKWQRLPDFKLSAFVNNELDGKDKGVGLSMDIPLWNFKSKEIEEAENIYLKEEEEQKALELEISTEVKSKLNKFRLSEQIIKLFHTGLLHQAEESLKISEVSYKQGEISLIDYLDSQRTYYSILRDYQESLYAWNTDKAALEKTIGEELK